MNILVFTAAVLAFWPAFGFSSDEGSTQTVEEVLPNEDLMREHGILNRLLLIYQEFVRRIDNREPFPVQTLKSTVTLVRDFVENYHEKLEEDYVFPLFELAHQQVELVRTLRDQHMAGRNLTDYIHSHSNENVLKDEIQRMLLADYMRLYIRMFRPHEAREDTVLFPAFRKLLSKEQYEKLGVIFESRERELFGKEGFEKIVGQVKEIEKKLNIYNLFEFTPLEHEKRS